MAMQEIYTGIKKRHSPGAGNNEFATAIYALYDEFRAAYEDEWERLKSCEQMYQGNHWEGVEQADENEPRPTMPIIFSTIENIKADLTDEYPEAVIMPEGPADDLLAKTLTQVVAQTLDAGDYDAEYDKGNHDILVGGYKIEEIGWDASLNFGYGGAFVRHQSNENVMFDPLCANIQDGRAVFKFDRLPKEWFEQHYPKHYKYMTGDEDKIPTEHGEHGVVESKEKSGFMLLLEAWFRLYDAEKHRYSVHMVKLAGGQVLENSYNEKPEGYFLHGMYPFVVTPLYEIKGSPLGLGVVDMFSNAQKYADKVDQVILKNAITAGRSRMLVQNGSADIADLSDYAKEVVEVDNLGGITWLQDKPLPSYILSYMMSTRQAIKEESGSNDFSRGNSTGGVTAASAITALQEMSSKRSRMEVRRCHYGFKQSVRMLIEVMREFEVTDREIDITINGQPVKVIANKLMYKTASDSKALPIEFKVSIKPVRETRFTKMANNELILQFCSMFQGQLDPVILLEAMEFAGQEVVLEKLRAAQGKGTAFLQQQLAEAQGAVEQLQLENQQYQSAMAEMQNYMSQHGQAAMPAAPAAPGGMPLNIPEGMALPEI